MYKRQGTVLLIDDDETVLTVGEIMLESIGFKVIKARNGREGVKLFAEHQKDVRCVVLDLVMPHMDGEEAYRELRQIQPDIKVILSSGYSHYDITTRFAGKGLSGFLKKPYRSSTLIKCLQIALEPQ